MGQPPFERNGPGPRDAHSGDDGWGRYVARADSFAGSTIRLRFHLDSDSTAEFGGAAIDDVSVMEYQPVPIEIDVQGNSVSISNGDTTPGLADHTDFGSTAVKGGRVVRTFIILNTGSSALTLIGTSWSGQRQAKIYRGSGLGRIGPCGRGRWKSHAGKPDLHRIELVGQAF